MGSPQEVVAPLQQLLAADGDFNVIAVVSQPARPVGRSGKLQDPPLAEFSKAKGLLTLQPESARDPEFLDQLGCLNVDVIVTAAYGQILSKKFLAIPKRATINIHPSLLPKYRGATPVPAALLEGESTTGVSVLFTVKALDAGAIICAREFPIAPDETAGTLTQRMFDFSGPLLIQALEKLRDPNFVGQPQDDRAATYCSKIEKSDGAVDWALPADVNLNRYRAFQPWPGLFTFFNGKRVGLLEVRQASAADLANGAGSGGQSLLAGAFVFSKPAKAILVRCSDGFLAVTKLQSEGGKPVDAAAFWNGIKDRSDCRFAAGG